jgi:hypothetical protein
VHRSGSHNRLGVCLVSCKNKSSAVLFAVYCVALLLLSGFKSADICVQYISAFERWLGGDKLMHFYLAALLAFLALPVARNVRYKNKTISVLMLFVLLMACLLVDEFHQALISTRYFDGYDTFFGGLGLIAGLSLGLIFEWYVRRK